MIPEFPLSEDVERLGCWLAYADRTAVTALIFTFIVGTVSAGSGIARIVLANLRASAIAKRNGPRMIPMNIRDSLVDSLRPYSGTHIQITYIAGSEEGEKFRHELKSLLSDAG